MEWIVVTLILAIIGLAAALCYITTSTIKLQRDFFSYADSQADRWSRSHYDMADRVLSHSDAFLQMKQIEAGEPASPAKPKTIVEPVPSINSGYDPTQGGFDVSG